MAIKQVAHRTGFITTAISAVSTLVGVDAPFLALVTATMNFAGGDYFYMTLEEDEDIEEVKVTDISSTNLVIVRAQGNTTAKVFSLAAKYDTNINKAAVMDISAGLAPVSNVNISGIGVATVTNLGGGNWSVNVPQPIIAGVAGIETTAAFPNYTVGITAAAECCAGDEIAPGAGVNVVGGGIVNVTFAVDTYTVSVTPPNFTMVGATITGTWPNYTITVTAAGTGTVTSVAAGAGLAITGNPNTTPTVTMPNTGVTANTYGDITFNSRGQATVIAATFNPVSAIVAGTGLLVSRAGGAVTVSAITAAEGVVGVVALADADVALVPTDITTAVTPKLLASVIADLQGGVAYGGQTYSGEADADYTYTVPTAALSLTLVTGEKAIVWANITCRDNTNPTVDQNYGIAVFSITGAARLQSNKKLTQNNQSMSFIIDGPFSDALALKTTVLAAGVTAISYSLVALKV